jgi:choline dehydrogenase-like flavoprotein
MKPIDSRELPKSSTIETGICIIGAGVAGISIAREFIGTSHDVCMIESGAYSADEQTQSLYDLESIGYPVRQNFMARARYLGGSSNLWAGRSMRLAPIDFSRRDWVPNSGWPIDYAELLAYYPRAEQVLELPDASRLRDRVAGACVNANAESALFGSDDLQAKVVMWGRRPLRFQKTYRKPLGRARNIRMVLNANVVELLATESGDRIESVRAATLNGNELRIRARVFVLACGGLENARLLLVSRRQHATGLGNRHDIVGRYFMEHPRAIFGSVRLTVPFSSSLLLGAPLPDGKVQIGIGLSDEAQRREQLVNSYLTLEPQLSRIAEQTFQSSANVVKVLMRRGYAGRRTDLFRTNLPEIRDLVYLLTPKEVMPLPVYKCYAALKAFSHRFRKVSDLTIINYCEQVPRPQSRVFLADARDRLGVNTLVLDWKIGAEETTAILRLQELFAERLERQGIGKFSRSEPDSAGPQYTDASHHMGTTRMSDDPRQGVVDRNTRVHDVENLFIAGSSVFPTVGYANPTLTIVALAIRLADHLKQAA